jgi:hypothetical protein
VTGLGAYNEYYLYVSSVNQNRAYRYVAPGVTSRYTYAYYTGASQTRDIAITTAAEVWVATDDSSIPVRLYNSDNDLLDTVDNSVIPAARGLTMDDGGFLWASDPVNDMIYKIDITSGIGGACSMTEPSLCASTNPFSSSVTIAGDGFGSEATISVYDVTGSLITRDSFSGSFVFASDGLSSGIYFATVQNNIGASSTLKLTRL